MVGAAGNHQNGWQGMIPPILWMELGRLSRSRVSESRPVPSSLPSPRTSLPPSQASALLSAISEPLVQISVGRMTRQLASPVKLQPTEARGVLSLWLLPNDNLSLMWHSSRSVGCGQGLGDTMADPACDSPLLREVTESSCRLAVWEELAHFPAGSQLLEDEPLMTIHMLRGQAASACEYRINALALLPAPDPRTATRWYAIGEVMLRG